jgi:hypothetical protein
MTIASPAARGASGRASGTALGIAGLLPDSGIELTGKEKRGSATATRALDPAILPEHQADDRQASAR